ncbi:ABC transporter related protein OS=Tsukamurella paurometabola (strain ATCC 8368 / DSM / CCUG 35730 / CIP 100753 / JCM 10117 / KCTC 9821 / NBRC 16120 / NCIMB 702349 / NCTC 13040) OX=521096 GN=Tpau_1652 PE=4 SV=1 [Tsukamurella paurometabola]|uniref:ABC transporter related protein n=1 Tax=Tsukamurella paurometabola (strain ATCC 8368 / DSM 20162 / CCUG 35730 / CIP 100753 / JCM 10117 / KCTC 9821 / NBRC 16120 / NCIMB 702349 / NCTC 13040) TaxID=521096 RepID=D5UYG6_TSUPD|nr:methionine ABC transporter ATP-binding protein [Tsukamurella paurometabola]ADG78273.1 ABC transporter related protein [Tsukamurella paurometabola DSM 20162]SUP30966.1 Methionine import ATP-binding protein MetN [Tsukamurella paurometabola]
MTERTRPRVAIEFRDATRDFGSTKALDGVSFAIDEGTITGVIGQSGAGKSTLIRTINGLESTTSGEVRVLDTVVGDLGERDLRELRAGIGMIFQRFNLMNSRTVAGNVEYPLTLTDMPKAERKKRVAELLDFVGIGDKASQYPSQLSGGQSQRVGIARALARNPKILLADEATSALDPGTTSEVLDLLLRVNKEFGTTIVVITHEMDVIRRICDSVAVLDRGKLVDYGPVYDVFATSESEATANLVHAAVGDDVAPETLQRLLDARPGTVVTVDVRDDIDAPDAAEVFATHGATARVLYGGVAEVGGRPFGSLTYSVTGDDAAITRAIDQLGPLAHVKDPQTGQEVAR